MTDSEDGNGFVVLDRRACLDRLGLRRVGAVAVTDGVLPLVLPAVYTMWGDDIVLGAHRDGVLGRCLPNSIVSICVFDVDDLLHASWSVTVTGRAEPVMWPLVMDPGPLLRTWGPDRSDQVLVRVRTDRITGRQIGR